MSFYNIEPAIGIGDQSIVVNKSPFTFVSPSSPDLRVNAHYPTEAKIRSGRTDEVAYQTLNALRLGITPSRETAFALVRREIDGTQWDSSKAIGIGSKNKASLTAVRSKQPHRFFTPVFNEHHGLSDAELVAMRRRIVVDPSPPPSGFIEKSAEKILSRVSFELISSMPDSVQLEAMRYISHNLDKLNLDKEVQPSDSEAFRALSEFLKTSSNRDFLIPDLLSYIGENTSDYTYRVLTSFYHEHTKADLVVAAMGKARDCYPTVMKHLAGIEDDTQMRKLLGIFVDRSSFAEIINSVRKAIENGENAALRPSLERIGRLLLGFDPDDTSRNFHANLDEFYKACDLSKMEHLQEAAEAKITLACSFCLILLFT